MSEFQKPIASEYGFQNVFTGPAVRVDPPRVEPTRFTRPELLKYLRWTDDDLVTAQSRFDFPAASILPNGILSSMHPGMQWKYVWKQDVVDNWKVETRAAAATMLALVGDQKKTR